MFKKLIWRFGKKLENLASFIVKSTELPPPAVKPDDKEEINYFIAPQIGVDLSRFLYKSRLKCVDIGARGEGLPELKIIAPFVDYFACEPELVANLELHEGMEGKKWRSYTLFKDAIGTGKYGNVLHVTQQPGLSSLLKPNNEVFSRYYNDDSFSVVSTENINLISLDVAANANKFEDACFLKIDTQGSELDILESGKELLSSSLVGIYVEAEFQSFYTDQPLFKDVDRYITSHGFELFDMIKSGVRRAGYDANRYSRRQTTWAHILYLKDIDILKRHPNRMQKMAQLFALAIAFENYDFALEMLSKGLLTETEDKGFYEGIKRDINAIIDYRTKISLHLMSSKEALLHAKNDIKMQWFG